MSYYKILKKCFSVNEKVECILWTIYSAEFAINTPVLKSFIIWRRATCVLTVLLLYVHKTQFTNLCIQNFVEILKRLQNLLFLPAWRDLTHAEKIYLVPLLDTFTAGNTMPYGWSTWICHIRHYPMKYFSRKFSLFL